MRLFLYLSLATALSVASSALAAEDAAPAERPYEKLPYTPSLDVSAMDRTVDACEDLYTYSCGGWKQRNPIPADQSSWNVYRKVQVDNQQFLWGILQEAATQTAGRSPERQKIGDYFAACMNEPAIEARGLAPLQPYFERIDRLISTSELPALLGDLHRQMFAGGLFFVTGSQQDAHDATKVIASVYASGLGLPDRDYYAKQDDKSREIRTRYEQHVARMFTLAGHSSEHAMRDAATVMRIETALANASLTRVEQRNPYNIYHRTAVRELNRQTPDFDWSAYFSAAGLQPNPWLNNSEPQFVVEMNRLLRAEPVEAIRTYLRWGLLHAHAAYLSKAIVDANFDFYSAYLRGVERQQPRWEKCVTWVDRDLGEALGRQFVERVFPASVKAQTVQMTEQIEAAMRQRIEHLDWMSSATREQALTKLRKMRNKVGYPDVWRDYSAIAIRADDFHGNVMRSMGFEIQRQAAKIGRPVDHSEWGMTPVTVNAYYDAQLNDINFPAAVLLPPLFDASLDDAPNYGNTGATIGHELTHGFDDEGRQFDSDGNLRDWWSKRDAKEFETRAQCVRNQYSQYTIVDDIKINGALTSGEDIADLGGLILAWVAWQEQTKAKHLEPRDELTPEQRFFVGFAQWTCANQRPEDLRVGAIVNPHSPPKARINGVVVNMPEFAKAFQCKAGKTLLKKPRDLCKIW